MSRTAKRTVVVGLFSLLFFGSPSGAQPQMFAIVTTDVPPFTTSLWEARIEEAGPREAKRLAVVDGWVSGLDVDGVQPLVAGGGQLVLWRRDGDPGRLIAFDRTSGTTHSLPDPGPLHVSDPTRARVFASVPAGVASLTPAGMAVLPGTAGLAPVAISTDGARLFTLAVTSIGPPRSYELRTIDSASGAALGAVPLGDNVVHVVPASDETAVWVLSSPSTYDGEPFRLREVLMPSGSIRLEIDLLPSTVHENVIARIEGVDFHSARVVVSITRRGAVLRGALLGAELRTIDTTTGAEVGRVPLEGEAASHLDRAAGTIVTYSPHAVVFPFGRCPSGFLHRVSLATGQELSRTPIDACLRAAFAAPPVPPSLDSPVVSPTRTVSLTWHPSPELTRGFSVEAGSAPGLSNLAVLPVTGGSLVVPNVPPGAYYVRVRALNYIGASVPSNEVVVVVP
jgi:hypothetical protein